MLRLSECCFPFWVAAGCLRGFTVFSLAFLAMCWLLSLLLPLGILLVAVPEVWGWHDHSVLSQIGLTSRVLSGDLALKFGCHLASKPFCFRLEIVAQLDNQHHLLSFAALLLPEETLELTVLSKGQGELKRASSYSPYTCSGLACLANQCYLIILYRGGATLLS